MNTNTVETEAKKNPGNQARPGVLQNYHGGSLGAPSSEVVSMSEVVSISKGTESNIFTTLLEKNASVQEKFGNFIEKTQAKAATTAQSAINMGNAAKAKFTAMITPKTAEEKKHAMQEKIRQLMVDIRDGNAASIEYNDGTDMTTEQIKEIMTLAKSKGLLGFHMYNKGKFEIVIEKCGTLDDPDNEPDNEGIKNLLKKGLMMQSIYREENLLIHTVTHSREFIRALLTNTKGLVCTFPVHETNLDMLKYILKEVSGTKLKDGTYSCSIISDDYTKMRQEKTENNYTANNPFVI